jgi:HAD superfamily hydrolase (TIGR01484 family)
MSEEKHMAAKMLLLDVDGTILDQAGAFFEGAESLVSTFGSVLKIGLCSARPLVSLVTLAQRLTHIEYLSALQGSIVAKNEREKYGQDCEMWEVIAESWLSKQDINLIQQCGDKFGFDAWFYDRKSWYVSRDSEKVNEEKQLVGIEPLRYFDLASISALKAALVGWRSEFLGNVPKLLQELRGHHLVAAQSRCDQIEIVSSQCSKQKGAELIARSANINKNLVIAVGDSSNDKGMLDFAKHAFVFENSPFELLKSEAVILPRPQEGGLRELALRIDQLVRTDGKRKLRDVTN